MVDQAPCPLRHPRGQRLGHDAVEIALDTLLKAQFANGAFPQVMAGRASVQPVKQASFPDYDWRSEGRIKNYWDMYTLNDGVTGSIDP